MVNLTFSEYHARFAVGVSRHGGTARRVANGGCLATFGPPDAPRFCVMSGVHGDERSGPLALLHWLENASPGTLVPERSSLWIAPLINDKGWDSNLREWDGLNLNAAFLPGVAPLFVQEYMTDLAKHVPGIFLDLHEDSEKDYAYVYRFTEDQNDFAARLQKVLDAQDMPWSSADAQRWSGSTEIYVRSLGCDRCATIEAPPVWPMEQRIEWNVRAVRWCLSQLSACSPYPSR